MNAPNKQGQFMPDEPFSLSLPVVSRKRFAEITGFPEGVVQGWIAKGYIPTYSVGKYTLINLALLNRMALDKAPWLLGAENV